MCITSLISVYLWHFAYMFQTTRLNIFNALLKNKVQNIYYVTKKIALIQCVERVEHFKNRGYRGKHRSFTSISASSVTAQALSLPAIVNRGTAETALCP